MSDDFMTVVSKGVRMMSRMQFKDYMLENVDTFRPGTETLREWILRMYKESEGLDGEKRD